MYKSVLNMKVKNINKRRNWTSFSLKTHFWSRKIFFHVFICFQWKKRPLLCIAIGQNQSIYFWGIIYSIERFNDMPTYVILDVWSCYIIFDQSGGYARNEIFTQLLNCVSFDSKLCLFCLLIFRYDWVKWNC